MLFVPDENETVTFALEGDDKDNPTLYEATPPSAYDAAIAGAMDAARMSREASRNPNAGMEQIERNIRRMSESEMMRRAARIKRISNAYPDGREIADQAEILAYIKRLMPAQQRSLEQCMGDAAYLGRLIFRGPDVVRPASGQGIEEEEAGEGPEGCGGEGIEG